MFCFFVFLGAKEQTIMPPASGYFGPLDCLWGQIKQQAPRGFLCLFLGMFQRFVYPEGACLSWLSSKAEVAIFEEGWVFCLPSRGWLGGFW